MHKLTSLALVLFMLQAAPSAAAEPTGVRLKWNPLFDAKPGAPASPSKTGQVQILLQWKTAHAGLRELLGTSPCQEDELKGLQFCITGLEGYGWLADFGERTFGTVLYLFNDQFFRYEIMVPEDDFSFVQATMERSLGEPTQSQPSTVHNRMGAEFDQLTLSWKLLEVDVVLTKRGDKVDKGLLEISYRPIAELVPKKPEGGTAPF